jgi:site-specific DNA-methyltransferase (adenine-specific)
VYDATIDLHDSYYATVSELRRGRVADRLRLECGDCLDVIPRLVTEGVSVDAVVTDPPYGLEFMGKEWDRFRDEPRRIVGTGGREAPFAHHAVALNGRRNSQYGVWCEAWARACFEILRPGGYLVAFGGTRTYHRLVCAIEDAGFVIQDQLAWLYGSGFPKHRSHLKPAHEPICLAYKPGGGRTLGVDECRVDGREQEQEQGNYAGSNVQVVGPRDGGKIYPQSLGRWPANVVHDGSAEVLAGFPDSAGQQGDVSGHEPSSKINHVFTKFNGRSAFPRRNEPSATRRYTENGRTDFAALPGARREATSAARFFYAAKADKADRWGSRHPTVKPIDLIRWLVTLTVPPGGTFLDPFAGSGTAAVAALASGRDAILIEREAAYIADIRERIAHYAGEGRHSLVAKGRARAEPAAGSLL